MINTTKGIRKNCFVCNGKGHHLSNNQVKKVKEGCWDNKKKRTNLRCIEKKLKTEPAVCELCNGEKFLFYPHL